MLQHFTHAQCEMSDKHFTHAQCKMSAKDGCSRLPKAALTSRGLHEGCPRLPFKEIKISRELKRVHKMCHYVPTRGLLWHIDDILDIIENEADDDDLRHMLKEDYTLYLLTKTNLSMWKREIVSWMH